MWHGVGFKNYGLLNDTKTEEEKKELARGYRKYRMVISSSKVDRRKKYDSLGCENTVITGSPRNDVFFHMDASQLEQIRIKYSLDGFNEIITYAPTYRDFETRPPFSETFWKELDNHLQSVNKLFVVKKHPWDELLKVPTGLKNIRDVTKQIDDPQTLLLVTNLLVTDYSSICTDFSLTRRPVIIYDYDLEEYLSHCRSIYYDFEKIMPSPSVRSERDLIELLLNDDWKLKEEIIQSQEGFRKMFHAFVDGNSSMRVFQEIQKL